MGAGAGLRVSAQEVLDQIRDVGVHSVRVVFADQHGSLRGKTIAADGMAAALENGIRVPGSLLHKDTGQVYAVGLWEPSGDEMLNALVGARDITMRPAPSTFRVLPWLDGTALILSDLETTGGDPIPHSTRWICARALDRLGGHRLSFTAGLELEFHLYRVGDDGALEHSHPGWDLLGEDGLDRIEPALEPIRQGLGALGMAPATIEAELGPSQIELTFAPSVGIDIADQAIIARTAIKHIARRNGYQATFMSRPKIGEESFPSGWHLHQSLVSADHPAGPSLLMPPDDSVLLSILGERYVAGILHNAAASCLLTTPTITGYKRYRPRAIAPDRITWSRQHRGAMLRIIGGPGDPATRVENRAGDPAANPYLYVASQVLSGLDGIENELTPSEPTDSPYEQAGGDLLPRTLGESIDAFAASTMYRDALGSDVVDYITTLKRSEWQRFNATVTDWEQREYFDRF
jgi:glutamine synthetase